MLNFIKGENLISNSEDTNRFVYNYMKRIIDDLEADWMFFQHDFLTIFFEISSNELLKKGSIAKPICELITRVFTSFMKSFAKNELIAAEILFRFGSLESKDEILNNYEREANFHDQKNLKTEADDLDFQEMTDNIEWSDIELKILKSYLLINQN